jgi:hypothetical protein
MNEPVYAYHLLKISQSFILKFLYKLENHEIMKEDLESENEKFTPDDKTLQECLDYISEKTNMTTSYYTNIRHVYYFHEIDWELKDV